MPNHKIAPAIDLMTQYLEEGYDADLIDRLNRRELAGLIVCPESVCKPFQDDKKWDVLYHFIEIRKLAAAALLNLVLEEIARND